MKSRKKKKKFKLDMSYLDLNPLTLTLFTDVRYILWS